LVPCHSSVEVTNMPLTGQRVAVLLAEGVEDLEYWVTVMRLQEAGADVITAAMELRPVRGKNGLEMKPDRLVAELGADDLDGIVIPGGWAPDKLRRYAEVTDLVRALDDRGKIVGIICHGGSVAISAGIVAGRNVTGSLGIKDDLVNAGGRWLDLPAFRDRNQVWGRVVADIPAFCRELVAALADAAGSRPAG
jgi:protease I